MGGLPAKARQRLFRAFKQVLEQAVTWQLIERNPAERIKNRQAVVDEASRVVPFEPWDDVDAICAELDSRYSTIPVVLVGCGLLDGFDEADSRKNGNVLWAPPKEKTT